MFTIAVLIGCVALGAIFQPKIERNNGSYNLTYKKGDSRNSIKIF